MTITRPQRARRRRSRWQAGFTLVELMVTIVVAGLVASSTFVFFAGQQRLYDTQTKLLNVQQNLWASMEVISRSIRAGGAGISSGCMFLRTYYNGVGVTTMPPAGVKNGASGAPDEITLSYFSGGSGAFVDTMLSNTIPSNWTASAMKVDDHDPFIDGDMIVVLDTQQNPPNGDRGCTLFQVTQVPGNSSNLIVNPSSPWNAAGHAPGLIPFDYTGGVGGTFGVRNVGRLVAVRFYVERTGAPAVAPRLMMDDLTDANPAQVVAYGIEDMQLAYACDVPPLDGTLTEGTDAPSRNADEWTFNQSGDAAPASCTKPNAVRVTLIARTLTEDDTLLATSGSTSSSFKPGAEDGAVGSPDTFRHRVLTTTISPRN